MPCELCFYVPAGESRWCMMVHDGAFSKKQCIKEPLLINTSDFRFALSAWQVVYMCCIVHGIHVLHTLVMHVLYMSVYITVYFLHQFQTI